MRIFNEVVILEQCNSLESVLSPASEHHKTQALRVCRSAGRAFPVHNLPATTSGEDPKTRARRPQTASAACSPA